jgi:UDP-N-acetylglucosamine transferase subunit ALG13
MAGSGAAGRAALLRQRAVIFVTVGTQLPFDRLIRAMDAWAESHPETEIFAQIGNGGYQPRSMAWAAHLPADAFRRKIEGAELIVSHAGTGNVLLALEYRKPIIVMPRRAALNEHRNDHQSATAEWLRQRPGVIVVDDAAALHEVLRDADWPAPAALRPEASPELLAAIRDFIDGG